MSEHLTSIARLVSVVAPALVAGVFFAFSSFVIPGLARLPAAEGIRTMQSINITAVRPPFMIALFGTGVISMIRAITRSDDPRIVAATALYVVGVIGVTIAVHVPRNNALAKLDAHAPGAEDAWHRYMTSWGRWNHARWVAGAASSAAFLAR